MLNLPNSIYHYRNVWRNLWHYRYYPSLALVIPTDCSHSVVFGPIRSAWSLFLSAFLKVLLCILYSADLERILLLMEVDVQTTPMPLLRAQRMLLSLVERILHATSAFNLWISSIRLRWNCKKTHFISLGGRAQLDQINFFSLHQRFPDIFLP